MPWFALGVLLHNGFKRGGDMSKSLEELILGAESQAAASAAVHRAVERADAAGLPPAYLNEAGEFAWLPKDPAKLLVLRRAVRQ